MPIYRKQKKLNKREKIQVKRMITRTQEIKYFDQTLVNVSFDYSGVLYNLTPINQGNTDTDRNGDQVMLKYVSIRGYLQASATSTYNVCRIIVFQWKPNSTPAISDILNNIASVNAPNSFYLWDKRQQYTVLWDKRYIVQGTDRQAALFSKKIYGKKLRKKLQFLGGGNSSDNRVYIIAISDDGGTPYPAWTWQSRVAYTDS